MTVKADFNLRNRVGAFLRKLTTPEAFTLILGLFVTTYMAFAMPMGFILDEPNHAFRAYELSEGKILPQIREVKPSHINDPGLRVGDEIPVALVGNLLATADRQFELSKGIFYTNTYYREHHEDKLYPHQIMFRSFENTVLYSPVMYAPQSLGFLVGRSLDLPVVSTLFLSRLMAGFAWTLLAVLAVRLLPLMKWLAVMAIFIPTNLGQAATLSADSMINAITILFICVLLRYVLLKRSLVRSDYVLVILTSMLLGLVKPPAPLLLALVPVVLYRHLTGTRLRRALIGSALILPGLALAGAWNAVISHYSVPYRNVALKDVVKVDTHGQAQYVLTHLTEMPGVLWETQEKAALLNVGGAFATVGTMFFPLWAVFAWLGAFLGVTAMQKVWPGLWIRSSFLAGLVAMIVAIAGLVYVSWSAVGASMIEGIQGRYYTSLSLLLVPVFAGVAFSGSGWRSAAIIKRRTISLLVAVTTLWLLALPFVGDYLRLSVAAVGAAGLAIGMVSLAQHFKRKELANAIIAGTSAVVCSIGAFELTATSYYGYHMWELPRVIADGLLR